MLYGEIAVGGTASVHLGALSSAGGFQKTVAIKRLHPNLARDPEFTSLLLDEARLAVRIVHPNVVQMLDVVQKSGETFLVMEYVHGETLHRLLAATTASGARVTPSVAVTVMAGVLRGLHAAHEATGDEGAPLGLVHRDVSPQNVMVGVDGLARVVDFGIAKAAGQSQITREGRVKGKLAYMAPEQIHGEPLTRQADVYGAAVVLWEVLTGERLFAADSEAAVEAKILNHVVRVPTEVVPELSIAWNRVILRALARDPASRFASALELADALEQCAPKASASEVGAWVRASAGEALAARQDAVRALEKASVSASRPRGPLLFRMTAAAAGIAALTGGAILWRVSDNSARSQGVMRSELPLFGVPSGAATDLVPSAPATTSAPVQNSAPSPVSPASPSQSVSQSAVSVARDASTSSPAAQARPLRPLPVTAAGSASTGVVGPAGRAPALSAAARPECDPPYVTDSAGHLRFKRECLQ